MNRDIGCTFVYKFPALNTWSEMLFGYSSIEVKETYAIGHRLKNYITSFAGKPLTTRGIELINSITETPAQGFLVRSVFNCMTYMVIASIISRTIEILSLALYTQEQQLKKKGAIGKFFTNVAYVYLPFCLLMYLGFPSGHIIVYNIINFLLRKVLPYKISNFIREIDYLSNQKDLNTTDFIKRNVLVLVRNLIAYPIVQFFVMFNIVTSYKNFKTVPVLYGGAKLEFCTVKDDNSITGKYYSDYDVMVSLFQYVMQTFGWMAGKIICDLVISRILKKHLKVKDLRDPLSSLPSRKALEEKMDTDTNNKRRQLDKVSRREHRQKMKAQRKRLQRAKVVQEIKEAKKRKEAERKRLEERKAKQNHKLDWGKRRKKGDTSWSATTYASISAPVSAKVGKAKKGRRKKKVKGPSDREKIIAEIRSKNQTIKVKDSFSHTVDGKELEFIRLEKAGSDKPFWGIIDENSVKKGHLDKYSRALGKGYISQQQKASIKQIDKGKFKLRPGNFDGRLEGIAYSGNGIYEALKSYMPLEDAINLSNTLEEEGEDVELIIFNREATKHNKLNNKV